MKFLTVGMNLLRLGVFWLWTDYLLRLVFDTGLGTPSKTTRATRPTAQDYSTPG